MQRAATAASLVCGCPIGFRLSLIFAEAKPAPQAWALRVLGSAPGFPRIRRYTRRRNDDHSNGNPVAARDDAVDHAAQLAHDQRADELREARRIRRTKERAEREPQIAAHRAAVEARVAVDMRVGGFVAQEARRRRGIAAEVGRAQECRRAARRSTCGLVRRRSSRVRRPGARRVSRSAGGGSSGDPGSSEPDGEPARLAQQQRLAPPRASSAARFAALHLDRLEAR
jgi:hypothetical protein